MGVFGELFNDLTGWLTVGVIVFMLVMMTFLFGMFISKSSKDDKKRRPIVVFLVVLAL